jgi:hypothetical protein
MAVCEVDGQLVRGRCGWGDGSNEIACETPGGCPFKTFVDLDDVIDLVRSYPDLYRWNEWLVEKLESDIRSRS